MKIIKSSLRTVNEDFAKILDTNDDFSLGYLIGDQIAIWDPIWINPNTEILPPIRYDERVIDALDASIIQMPLAGGAIVSNVGDIGIITVSKDKYSKWELAAMEDVVKYLKLRYKLNAEISGNDILLDGKKFIGTSIGFSAQYRYAAMFISMNNYTAPLINLICTKQSEHKGFIGLSKYKVCPRKLLTRILRFTRKWEAKAL